MARTSIGLVIASGSKILRRVIVPDDDVELENRSHVQPGEMLIRYPADAPRDLESLKSAVQTATGVLPPSARTAVVNANGDVVGLCLADPALDKIDGHMLVLSDEAHIGWRHSNGKFQAPYAIVDRNSSRVTEIRYLDADNPQHGVPNALAVRDDHSEAKVGSLFSKGQFL